MTAFQTALAETDIQISGTLSDILSGTTRLFTITVTDADDDAVDISGDTMTFRLKRRKGDLDSAALISKAASSMSALGVASFSLSPTETDVQPGSYYSDVEWVTSGAAIYVVYDKEIRVLQRVSDE